MGILDMFKKRDGKQDAAKSNMEAFQMSKSQLGMVLLKIMIRGEEAVLIKFYRDGTIVRNGAGGIPKVEVGALCHFPGDQFWNVLLSRIPDSVLDHNVVHQEETIQDPFSYTLAFFGDSGNGQTGEDAQWRKSYGIHLEADLHSKQHHPLLSQLDKIATMMVGITNDWFFDVVVFACLDMKSDQLLHGLMSIPKTDEAKRESWEQFLMQVLQSPNKEDLLRYPEGKTYSHPQKEGRFRLELSIDGDEGRFDFVPIR